MRLTSPVRVSTQHSILVGVLAATVAISSLAHNSLPAHVVGEWAPLESQFEHGVLQKGVALYILPEGRAMILGAPPPIGVVGPVTYGERSRVVTLTLTEHGKSLGKCQFAFDPKEITLEGGGKGCGRFTYRRRQATVPSYIADELKPRQ